MSLVTGKVSIGAPANTRRVDQVLVQLAASRTLVGRAANPSVRCQ